MAPTDVGSPAESKIRVLNASSTGFGESEDTVLLAESHESSLSLPESAESSGGEHQDQQGDETQDAGFPDRAVPVATVSLGPNAFSDAIRYLDQVKAQFSERPDAYKTFLEILQDFKNGRLDTPGVLERAAIVFHDHPSLMQGLNTFIPNGYRMMETVSKPVTPGENLVTPMSKL
ncbi:hypothetical protein VTO73DRAFT_6884 [Trametes versicolor]